VLLPCVRRFPNSDRLVTLLMVGLSAGRGQEEGSDSSHPADDAAWIGPEQRRQNEWRGRTSAGLERSRVRSSTQFSPMDGQCVGAHDRSAVPGVRPAGRVGTITRHRVRALHLLWVSAAITLLTVGSTTRQALAQMAATSAASNPASGSAASTPANGTNGGAAGASTAGSRTASSTAAGATTAPRAAGSGNQEDDPESRPLKQAVGAGVAREERGGEFFMDVLGKLAMVVALIFACAAIWRKFHASQPQSGATSTLGLQVVTTLPLGAQRFVHVVAAGRRHYLIGSSSQAITLLAELDAPHGAAGGHSGPGSGYGGSVAGQYDLRDSAVDDGWGDAAADGGDRFEELLLRLKHLESEQAARGRSDGGAFDEEPHRGRGGTPPRQALPERRAPAERETRRNNEGTSDGRALAPGDLFRSGSEGPRGGRYA
jgi:flagellar biogenesis protein FliO